MDNVFLVNVTKDDQGSSWLLYDLGKGKIIATSAKFMQDPASQVRLRDQMRAIQKNVDDLTSEVGRRVVCIPFAD